MQSAIELSMSSPKPVARRSAAGGVFDGSLYVFGGIDAEGRNRSDGWRLSLDDHQWERLSSDDLPPVRLPGISALDDRLYLFGGRGGDETFFDEVWIFDNGRVSQLDVDGSAPDPRYGHSQVSVAGQLFVFGGLSKQHGQYTLYDDLWRFDPETAQWSSVDVSGPSPRYGVAIAGWEHEFVVFGGRYLTDEWWFHNDTWLFDVETNRWSRIETDSMPGPRYTLGVATTEDAMYIYGGMVSRYQPFDTPVIHHLNRFLTSLPVRNSLFPTFKPNQYLRDLWRFDRESRSWSLVTDSTRIPPLKTPVMGKHGDSIVVALGNNPYHYNAVWTLPECL